MNNKIINITSFLAIVIIILIGYICINERSGTLSKKIIKEKDMLFCGSSSGLYQINLKTGAVEKLFGSEVNGFDNSYEKLLLDDDWLYFIECPDGVGNTLYRINIKNRKLEKLVDEEKEVISGKTYKYNICYDYTTSEDKLYYNGETGNGKLLKIKMDKNGNNKELTFTKIRVKTTDDERYKINIDEINEGLYKEYLVTPKGQKYYLGEIS